MKVIIQLSSSEVHRDIPYQLICESRYGALWDTMRRKRRWAAEFTFKERDVAIRLFHQAAKWAIGTGVPDTVRMQPETYELWQKLGEFCSSL